MVVLTRLGPPEEGIRHRQEATAVFVNERPLGRGALYISEARLSWVGDAGQGFSLEYPHVALHAIQRAHPAAFPEDNLYLVIDVRLVESDETPTPSSTPNGSDDESEDGLAANDKGMTEIRFVPEDKTKLGEMFAAMSACQALHPDPADSSEEGEGEEQEEAEAEAAEQEQEEEEEEEGMFDDAEEGDGEPMDEDTGPK